MKVVVVVVTYNPLQWIEKCLNSLLSSSIPVEIYVVDNCSTDGSQEIIKNNYSKIDLIESSENLGFGGANNIGIKKAYENGADFVFLLNQDAWVEADTIEKLIIAHQKEFKYGIVSPIHLNGAGDALDYNFSNYIIPSKCMNLYSDIYLNKIEDKIYNLDFVNAAAWLISRECIEKIGGFNPSFFHYGEDDNYIQRIKYHQLKIGILPIAKIFHDRGNRTKNIYFEDAKIFYRRTIVLKSSNVFYEFSFRKEYIKRYKIIFKSILFFKKSNFIDEWSKIKILNKMDKEEIIKNRQISKIPQKSFL